MDTQHEHLNTQRDKLVRLRKLESTINWCIWVPLCISSFVYAVTISKKYAHLVPPHSVTETWFGLRVDNSDTEWTGWVSNIYSMTLVSSVFSVSSVAVRFLVPRALVMFQTILSLFLLSWVMSWNGVLVVLVHMLAFLCVLKTGSVKLVWVWSLLVLYVMPSDGFWDMSKLVLPLDEDNRELVIIGLLMCYLRFLSYGHHILQPNNSNSSNNNNNTSSINSNNDSNINNSNYNTTNVRNASLLHFTHYTFYVPLFFNGPLLTYDLFNVPLEERNKIDVYDISRATLTSLLYACGLHLFFSIVFTTAIATYSHILLHITPFESVIVMWMLIQVFYMKYVVFYRSSGVFVKMDGLVPPEGPRCITSLYTFTHMWRFFDRGLHRFLGQSIYVPLGGSRAGIVQQMLSSLCCFAFVAHWHTGGATMWLWAAFNYVGIAVEKCVGLLTTCGVLDTVLDMLSLRMYRRVCALCGALLVVGLIWSNIVFLVGYEAALVLITKSLSGGVTFFLYVIGVMYFCCQCSMDCLCD